MPRGVDEAVIDVVLSGSDRSEGSRGGNEGSDGGSAAGLLRGESSSVSGEVGDLGAKSIASPGTCIAP
jgi:hypothetical protein